MEDNSRPVFTIGVVADIIGVSVQTLRLWEQKGLISPSRKGKDRYYSEEDMRRLKYIKHLLKEKKLNTYGVLEVLRKEGWEVQAESPEDEGEEPGMAGAQKAAQFAIAEQKTILIIDDDFDHVSSVKTVLESENHIVLTALSGRDGLDKAETANPDLIVLDIMIPDLDGVDICNRLKKSHDHKKIPILVLSNIPSKMRDKFGISDKELPADDFFEKPLRPREFLERVRTLLA